MSGGSLDYISHKLDDVADTLKRRRQPDLRALGEHVLKLARVLHDVEWYLSCDTSNYHPENIRALLGPTAVLETVKADAEKVLEQLRSELERIGGAS